MSFQDIAHDYIFRIRLISFAGDQGCMSNRPAKIGTKVIKIFKILNCSVHSITVRTLFGYGSKKLSLRFGLNLTMFLAFTPISKIPEVVFSIYLIKTNCYQSSTSSLHIMLSSNPIGLWHWFWEILWFYSHAGFLMFCNSCFHNQISMS